MPAPDFRLYHSNALDLLAELLARELRSPAPGRPLLAPDTILIPQVAMRRWLQAHLAQKFGIAANLEFVTPGEFVARALDANLGKTGDELDAATLHWRLYAALTDPALLAQPALAPLAAALAGDDPLKPWALAAELAAVFEKYQAWRRDWLLRWDAGGDPDDAQAVLWRAVAGGRQHRARRIRDYLARFGEGGAAPAGLPPRLFAFATLNISPDVLRVLASQARVGTLHCYVPTPVADYWGDLQSLRAQLRAGTEPDADADGDHPLLRDCGAAGRDFMALLGGYEVVHASAEIDARSEPGEASLLRALQSDLFHRRAAPPSRLAAPDLRDPSLQFHACHTRLRELQVLHDRLRALLDPTSEEGRRFDPPLQPRDIAVLAPDIDPYVACLPAVFGAAAGADAIPYALADASPLADEPLADLFLRLLALPIARFGLEEILDLLASPALAEANGLAAADLERLRLWLQAAGARWGLDGGHRARLGAPMDALCTWQFALDRLLLGYASGDAAMIAGVAPWPALEGGALAALDTLLRLLRSLARQQRSLAEAATPAQWRERLLGLLDALLPQPPSAAASQRALERLRKLIDGFAREAARAGFAAEVPAEAVRAHFAAALAEADTRAPLLTGGVSFARMVPMRLLPFRVICLLGMNDGDFPRRDPAAGLSKLAAEIAQGRRLPGDRSNRDDDRFLFLQLFTAAQDVLYLSWLGADPRDGSAREPSPLVTELLTVAADRHADTKAAKRALVLRHPLQPFAPAAFGVVSGDGDPRVYSYRRHWQPACARLSGARTKLAPWLDDDAALEPPAAETELSLAALRGFLFDPAGQFLRQRLQLRLPERDERGDDLEPLQAPASGLARSTLQRALFEQLQTEVDPAALQARLCAQGLLPAGALGRRVLDAMREEVAPYADAWREWRGDTAAAPLPLEVTIDGLRLHGRLDDVLQTGIARLRIGTPNGRSAIRHGLDWLLACAAGQTLPLMEFHDGGKDGLGPHERPPLPQAQAIAALRALMALRREGLQRPLPFALYSSWALFEGKTAEAGLRAAAGKWRGSGNGSWAEGEDVSLRLSLRGRDPFSDAAARREFARVAGLVFGLVTAGEAKLIETDGIELPEEDTEDAA